MIEKILIIVNLIMIGIVLRVCLSEVKNTKVLFNQWRKERIK